MNRRLLLIVVLLAIGLTWGSTQTLGKLAVSTGYRPFGLLFWQLVVGVLSMGGLMLLRGKRFEVNAATLRFALIIALIGTILPGMAFWTSVQRLPAGIMSILISTVPLLALPIAVSLGMDRFGLRRLSGLACGTAAVALIALPGTALPDVAMAAFLPVAMIAPLFYALESNYVARWGTAGLDGMQAMFGASLAGAVIVLPLALGSGQWINPLRPWGVAELAILAASLAHAFAYAAYIWLAANAGAVFATQTGYVVTVSGVFWAMLLLGERFSGWVWLALVVMLSGLSLVQPRQVEQKVQ